MQLIVNRSTSQLADLRKVHSSTLEDLERSKSEVTKLSKRGEQLENQSVYVIYGHTVQYTYMEMQDLLNHYFSPNLPILCDEHFCLGNISV